MTQFPIAHRFTGPVLYEAPVGKGKRADLGSVRNAVAGDWQLGSIFTISTGTPINGGDCGDLGSNTQGNRGDNGDTGFEPRTNQPSGRSG